MRRLVSVIAGAALAIAGFTYGASAGSAQPAGLVAFQSDRSGNSDIWLVDDDGSNPRRLTRHPEADATPAWTPDGRSIVFASDRAGNWDLWRIDADGTNLRRLTTTKADEFDPVVSPDGNRVAYESDAQGNWDVFTLDLSTGDQTRLSRSVRRDEDPSWAPDSSRVAYTTVFDRRNAEIVFGFPQRPGGSQTIVGGDSVDFDASWSDAGIVFTRQSGATRDLYILESGSSDPRAMSTGSTDDWGAVRADNGNILFVRETDPLRRAEPYRIWVMNESGGDQRQLVQGGDATDSEPAPQPGSNPRRTAPFELRSLAAATSHCRFRFGNDEPNTIIGTRRRDCIFGRGGGDRIHGKGGGDPVLRGGPGADRFFGWQGDDVLYANDAERDQVRGGPGGNQAYADPQDTVIGATIH